MLILARKKGQSIILKMGDKILKIKFVDIDNNVLKLGFDGPKEIKIYREEIYEEIVKENKQAIEITGTSIDELKKLFGGK